MWSTAKVLYLDGLDCVSCAVKIEDNIKKINGIRSASINFLTKTLKLELIKGTAYEEIVPEVKKIVASIEPHVKVFEEKSKEDIKSQVFNRENLILLTGIFLFLAALLPIITFNTKLFFYIAAYLIVGGKILKRAFNNIVKGQIFDENFLMSLATLGAFGIEEYPEGVAVMVFYRIGELFQDIAVNRSRKSIEKLMDIRGDYANLKTKEGTKKVNPDTVEPGDIIIVKPGEKIPLDGIIVDGKSLIDTSSLTGESLPKNVKEGSEVLSGYINKTGLLNIKVTKRFNQSTASKILELMENAAEKKSPTEKFITKFAKVYTPAVVAIATGLGIIPPFLGYGDFSQWIYRALVFLVISCPCALVISIPLTYFGGIGGASRRGILVKGGNYLEALNSVEIIAFDKTGTLTEGIFKVTEIAPKGDFDRDKLLELGAYTEYFSNHPIALSIIKEYKGIVDKSQIRDYTEIPGLGVRAVIKGNKVVAGNSKLMNEEGIDNIGEQPGTTVHFAVDGNYVGYISVADNIKEDSKKTIKAIKEIGIKKTVMLTGDNKIYGMMVGQILGLDEVYSQLLPHGKVEIMEKLFNEKSAKGKLVYVGDGINDAPVLARADIGMAMGGIGSDAAIEAADIVIMDDKPEKVLEAIKIAKKTRRIATQNIILSLGVKGLVLILGALGFATMWEAVFADVGVALLAVLNAMRIIYYK